MNRAHVDAVVIGMGPGGEELAGKLAEAGLSVVGVERELVGGECPYWGCIPTKMAVRGSGLLAEARRVRGMAGGADARPDYGQVARRIRAEATADWDDRIAVERFEGRGGRLVRGSARLDGVGRVVVGEQEFEVARAVVIATGSAPVIPPIPGLDGLPFWTNRDAVKAETQPESLIVLGGGAIGLELAQAFHRFGTKVTVVEAADRLLALEEPEAGTMMADVFRADGITVHTGRRVVDVSLNDRVITARLNNGEPVTGSHLLVATGRRAAMSGLGLATVGIDENARAVAVDDHMRAGERLWSIGDVTGRGAFTHMAMYQAGIALRSILHGDGPAAEYHAVPRVTFTDPEIGAVGLGEAAARAQGIDVRTGIAQVSTSARGWIHGPGNAGFIKLVEDASTGCLVGATSAGPLGGEVLSMLTLAVQERVPSAHLRRMIYAYPTFHRGVEDALRDLAVRPEYN